MSRPLLQQGLQESSQEDAQEAVSDQISLESVMSFFRRRNAAERRTEKQIFPLEDLDKLVEQVYKELDEFLDVSRRFPDDVANHDDDFFHEEFDFGVRSLSYYDFLRYCIRTGVGAWAVQSFLFDASIEDLLNEPKKHKDGDVVHQTDLLTFTITTINRDRRLMVDFDFRLSRDSIPRDLEKAISTASKLLAEAFSETYGEGIQKNDETSFLVDWDEIEDDQSLRETLKEMREFRFGHDGGTGNYVALLLVDGQEVVVDWDHEDRKVRVK